MTVFETKEVIPGEFAHGTSRLYILIDKITWQHFIFIDASYQTTRGFFY